MRFGKNRGTQFPAGTDTIQTESSNMRQAIPDALRDAAEPYLELWIKLRTLLLEPQPLEGERIKKEAMLNTLAQVLKVFNAGFEPTTPNKDWYAGALREGMLRAGESYHFYPNPGTQLLDKFTEKNPKGRHGQRMLVFAGIIPAEAQAKIVQAETLFGENRILICSPHLEDFRVPAVHVDPVAVGLLENVPERGDMFFEIARWDTSKDLQSTSS